MHMKMAMDEYGFNFKVAEFKFSSFDLLRCYQTELRLNESIYFETIFES